MTLLRLLAIVAGFLCLLGAGAILVLDWQLRRSWRDVRSDRSRMTNTWLDHEAGKRPQ